MSDELEAEEIVKVSVIAGAEASRAIQPDDEEQAFSDAGAILPPYDPRTLCVLFERSAALRPNVDAYITNIEGFGHRFELVVDPEKPAASDQVRDALILEKLADQDPTPDVPAEEVEAALLMLRNQVRLEGLRLNHFFEACGGELSLVELRSRTRLDLEVTGNAYWEVLRDPQGAIAQFGWLPAASVRLRKLEVTPTTITERRKVSAISYRRFETGRRFRTFVQLIRGVGTVFFKELGDPRTVSSVTGRVYMSEAELQQKERSTRAATEVVHWRVHSPISPYGVPRWVGATLAVVGSRAAEETNAAYFDNKAVPPLAILVSGAKLAPNARERIEKYIETNIKGRKNFHSILLIEAEGAQTGAIAGANGSRVRIELKPLTEAQQQDALFQNYDQANTDKVGAQFRVPRLLRGDVRDFNRSTAEASLDFAEQQVFQPERIRFDSWINRKLLPILGVRFHRFVSIGVQVKDPPTLQEMVTALVQANVLTPGEAREHVEAILGRPVPKLDAPWTEQPMALSLEAAKLGAGVPSGAEPLAAEARKLISLRAALAEFETQASERRLELARHADAQRTVEVPAEEFRSWIEAEPPQS